MGSGSYYLHKMKLDKLLVISLGMKLVNEFKDYKGFHNKKSFWFKRQINWVLCSLVLWVVIVPKSILNDF